MNLLKGGTLLPRPLRRRDVTTYHMDEGAITVHHLPVICTPYPSPWEHPIYWWKMRHLRHDIKVMTEAVDPELKRKFEELEARAFINGTGGN